MISVYNSLQQKYLTINSHNHMTVTKADLREKLKQFLPKSIHSEFKRPLLTTKNVVCAKIRNLTQILGMIIF